MRIISALALGYVLCFGAGPAAADESPAKSKIVAVGLFKNELAVVRRELTLSGPGVYVVDDVPDPVHGTFWVDSAAPVDVAVRTREEEVPAETAPGDLEEELAGKKVTVHLKDGKLPPVAGTVVKFKPPKSGERAPRDPSDGAARPARFLVVQTPKGRCYLDASEVAFVEAEGADGKAKRRKPRLLLTLGATDRAETKVAISYLARGLGWAPAYKIDITDPKTLTLEQQAVVRNELADLDGAEVRLISGFPSVQFAGVTSPLSPRTSWAAFLQELGQGTQPAGGVLSNTWGQSTYAGNGQVYLAPGALRAPVTPAGEGVDLHYQPIGKRTLARGDSLLLSVAKGKAPYERIVEWLVADTRDESGRNAEARGRGDGDDDNPWDALRFRNPLPFPMTTGPAVVTADGKFNGQRSAFWANSGEETVVRVDKALSVRARSLEREEQKNPGDGRDLVWVGGRQFRRAVVEGELTAANHRAEAVRLVIRRRFSGDLLGADGEPKASLREEGVYSVNRRNELLWTLPLNPGEERKLKYRYAVLVAN